MVSRWAVLFLISTFAAFQMGCSTSSIALPPLAEPPSKLYRSDYDKVWRSTQQALRKYPIKLNNMDSGILETDWIKNDKFFSAPVEQKSRPGMRYKLTLRVVKGELESKPVIRVTCIKTIEVQKDFFSGFETIRPDGLEEGVVLYRIRRFLEIDRVLTKLEPPSTTSSSNTEGN